MTLFANNAPTPLYTWHGAAPQCPCCGRAMLFSSVNRGCKPEFIYCTNLGCADFGKRYDVPRVSLTRYEGTAI